MLFKLASLAFLVALARGQESQVALIPKDCEYVFDGVFFEFTEQEASQYSVTEQCNYVEVNVDGADDITYSWMYQCDGDDMELTVYTGTVYCDAQLATNTSMERWEAADDPRNMIYRCVGLDRDNCDVKANAASPCEGIPDALIEVWPAKDICVNQEDNSSLYYECIDESYQVTSRDALDCGIPYESTSTVVMYTTGCEDDRETTIKCNSAYRTAFSLASFVALIFALIR